MARAVSRVWKVVSSHPNKSARHRVTYLDENDRGANRHQTIELDQNLVLGLVIVTVQVDLFDSFHSQVFVLEGHLIGTRRELLGIFDDIVGEGG